MKRTALKRGKALKRTPLKSKPKSVPREIQDHWARVRQLGCIVSFSDDATIHHVHGGSIAAKLGARGMPGIGQRQNHWLVIPLAPRLHVGDQGIDSGQGMNVAKWEAKYGSQFDYLMKVRDAIRKRHGYDILERAKIDANVN